MGALRHDARCADDGRFAAPRRRGIAAGSRPPVAHPPDTVVALHGGGTTAEVRTTAHGPEPAPRWNGALALVTGATGRIGRAIGLALRDAGAEVLLHGRTPGRVAALRRETGLPAIAADLTRPEAVEAVRARVARRGGRLDVLTLGSGIYERSQDPAVLDRMLAANVLGPYALLRALLPFLAEARGQVVFVNSTQGLAASGNGVGQFAATQHAMRAVADSLRDEVNAEGVRVLSLFLGRTATDRQRGIFALEGRPYPAERLIQPEDVAEAVLAMLRLPRTVEATQLTLRPMQKV